MKDTIKNNKKSIMKAAGIAGVFAMAASGILSNMENAIQKTWKAALVKKTYNNVMSAFFGNVDDLRDSLLCFDCGKQVDMHGSGANSVITYTVHFLYADDASLAADYPQGFTCEMCRTLVKPSAAK